MNQKVVDKIQKLLALATSSNEHEAKLATERANELLIKHNLSMQDITYTEVKDFVEKDVSDSGKMKVEDKYILPILRDHFFVTPVISRSRITRMTTIVLMGEATNVQVASYIYGFLNRTYKSLWKQFQDDSFCSVESKQPYYKGLLHGLSAQLKAKRKVVEQETSLVVIEDPDLKKWLAAKKLGNRQMSMPGQHGGAYTAGIDDGKKLHISMGIESKSNSGKFLK